jgi:hypothetical protein
MLSVSRTSILAIATVLGACGGSAAAPPSTAPRPSARPLAALISSGAIIAPTFSVSAPADQSAASRIGDGRGLLRDLDSNIVAAFAERGLRRGWIFPSDLAASYRRNPGYATDPYALAEEPLLRSGFTVGSRLPEPLASQLRTMIALHEDARLVLLPVQLSLEAVPGAPGVARASLKVALVDPRFSEAQWVGDVASDTTSADPRALTAAVAARLVDLIVGR